MSFTCECGCHHFYASWIQGGNNLDLLEWGIVHCLRCDKKYLFRHDLGFKAFDPEIVKT